MMVYVNLWRIYKRTHFILYRKRLEKLSEIEYQQKLNEWLQKEQEPKQTKEKKKKRPVEKENKPDVKSTPVKSDKCTTIDITDDDSDDEMAIFKQPEKKRKMTKEPEIKMDVSDSGKLNDSIMTNDSSANNSLMTEDEDGENQAQKNMPPRKTKPKIPVIFFCTRTHKQISQIVKELKRTNFNDVKSCVLASREHTCIQDINILAPEIKFKTKTEMCRELLDPKARNRNSLKYRISVDKCSFHDNGGLKLGTYNQLSAHGLSSVWDVEELVEMGKKRVSCPYYGSRLLMKNADIVFCPYNYVIDPIIRGTLGLNLQGHVLIVDEAHNIEDQCRDAASLQLDQTNLNLAKMDCEKMSELGSNSVEFAAIAQYLSDLSVWTDKKSAGIKSYDDYNRGVISWSGVYTVASFNEYGLGLDKFESFKKNCSLAVAQETEEETDAEKQPQTPDEQPPKTPDEQQQNTPDKSEGRKGKEEDSQISNATKQLLTSVCTVFDFLFDDKYKNDYHVSLEKVMHVKKFEHGERPVTVDGWITSNSKDSKKDSRAVWVNTVSFLCLNPAAVFQDLKVSLRSIILTSGTLSPMDSFQSELGTQFPIALEANHVIKADQCWVGSVSAGPNRVDLNGQHQNTNTYGFQDEMGLVLKKVCETVPFGVLCFMPSYNLMEKLYERWQLTGMLGEINRIKTVLCEPRRGDELEHLMYRYYNAIKTAEQGKSRGGQTGAVFLAVYRGKISEGLDFSDNNARAVVAVGIPFPNYKEVSVHHKKEYNNKYHKEKGLLDGWQWYQIQAYRALNQALGRCIRHKNDWGAILLVDSRYAEQRRTAGLSKWIRGRVERPDSWSTVQDRLRFFVESRQNEV
ncbi:Fanconi anemia group J protein homolog isoform X2 [Adelges cooleyi]|uniref:Fanconi anemia group J protein homolog isoform X2 n=1 Tax=Adelges cooleyi TaxID=133065 RepID=UPI00217FC723|nr:Fanconi anemia group J protein homolog isoform X2 [Adelges cooleyi]